MNLVHLHHSKLPFCGVHQQIFILRLDKKNLDFVSLILIGKLLGIINVAFDATGPLLIIYSSFAKCLRKNGNTMKKFISFL